MPAVKVALGERVSDVRASQRLTESAACLVAGGQGRDRELERLLARQNRGAGAKPILELNMRHALVKAIAGATGADAGRGPVVPAARAGAHPRRRGAGRSGGLRGRLNRLVLQGVGKGRVGGAGSRASHQL